MLIMFIMRHFHQSSGYPSPQRNFAPYNSLSCAFSIAEVFCGHSFSYCNYPLFPMLPLSPHALLEIPSYQFPTFLKWPNYLNRLYFTASKKCRVGNL